MKPSTTTFLLVATGVTALFALVQVVILYLCGVSAINHIPYQVKLWLILWLTQLSFIVLLNNIK